MWVEGKLRFFGALAAFALFVNAMLPLSLAYGMSGQSFENLTQAEQDLLFALNGDVLLCTSDGLQIVSRSDFEEGKVPAEPHPRYQCALCYLVAFSAGPAISTSVTLVNYPEEERVFLPALDRTHLIRLIVSAPTLTRGPPQQA